MTDPRQRNRLDMMWKPEIQPLSKRYMATLYSHTPEFGSGQQQILHSPENSAGHLLFHFGAPYREFRPDDLLFLSNISMAFMKDILSGPEINRIFNLVNGREVGEFYSVLLELYRDWWNDDYINEGGYKTNPDHLFSHLTTWLSKTKEARKNVFLQFEQLILTNPNVPLSWHVDFLEKETSND